MIDSSCGNSTVAVFWASVPESLHPESTVAEVLSCSTAKLQTDRWKGRGIPFVRIGKLIRYRKADVLASVGEPVRSTTEADERDQRAA